MNTMQHEYNIVTYMVIVISAGFTALQNSKMKTVEMCQKTHQKITNEITSVWGETGGKLTPT